MSEPQQLPILDETLIEALLSRAAKKGAKEALESLGLHDEDAVHDVQELRSLLDAWRGTKKTILRTIAQAVTMLVLGAIATGTFLHIKTGGK